MPSHKDWVEFANFDLMSARGLINLKIYITAVYHCQQCAEKILKAFLAFHKQKIKKTHDLVTLIDLCSPFDKSLVKLVNIAGDLKPFATEFRYPDDSIIPDKQEATLALEQAQKIFDFVKQKITDLETGQKSIF